MEKNYWKKYSIWYTIISSALIFMLCIFLFKDCSSAPECIEIIKRDTITVIHDSIIEKVKWRTNYDTVFTTIYVDSNSLDTIKKEDTLHIPIDYKQASFKASKDSIDIEADIHYHGFQANIDTVEFRYNFHWTLEVTKPKPKKIGFVWYIGLGVGGGANINVNNRTFDYGPNFGLQGGVGIGGYIK